jgi:two-component system, NtrC family, sensor histidine kinase AtoS
MSSPARHYRLAVRLWVILAVAMAVAASASTLGVLYLARPFIAERGGLAPGVQDILFLTAIAAAILAGIAGLALGVALSRRVWALVERTEAAAPIVDVTPNDVRDELGALDVAVGRLTVSMDRLISDSAILGQLPAAILVVDDARRLVSANTTADTLLGPHLSRFYGRPLLGVDGAMPVVRGNEPFAELLGQADKGRAVLHVDEVAVSTSAGRALLLDATIKIQPGGDTGGGFVILLRDASEKRRIREQIKRADQLAFLGEIATRIAHEVRTPLASLRGLVELLEADIADPDRARQYLERIVHAIEHQEQLVDKLLSFTHPQLASWEPVAVGELLEGLIAAWPGRRPILALQVPLASVLGDAVLLGEVFTNLIQNAVEASGGGTVTVRALMSDSALRIEVTNEGAAIPPELHERIFQPFFTTKPNGTGLGLAIARQIVEAHHGVIRIHVDVAVSTTSFVVDLPVSARG